MTEHGYSFPEVRRYAEFLRRELLLLQDVKTVELFAGRHGDRRIDFQPEAVRRA